MEFIQSPNRNDSSYRKPIDRIVIHWFGTGNLDSAISTFTKPNSTSAHYAVSDKRVVQFVKEEEVAWHAGYFPMNQRSIGIEHDATTKHVASDDTYATSANLIAEISKRYSIPLDREHIIKHSEVKATQCCGTVDVNKLISMAKEILGNEDECTQRVKELEIEVDKMRDSRNTWKADSKAKDIIIAQKDTEILNRIEQIGRKDALIGQKDELINKLTLDSTTAVTGLKNTIVELERTLDETAKEKGRLNLLVTNLEEQLKQLNSQPKEISIPEAIVVILNHLLGRKV